MPAKTKDALLTVDIQNDYFQGGANPLVGSLEASEKASELLAHFRGKGKPVFHLQHISGSGATFFLPNTLGSALHENIAPIDGELVVQKRYPNGFRGTGLVDDLWKEDVKNLVICGMMTHMCIDATVRAAKDLGFDCTVISDACATKDLEFNGQKLVAKDVHAAFLAALSGFYAKIKTTQEFLSENS